MSFLGTAVFWSALQLVLHMSADLLQVVRHIYQLHRDVMHTLTTFQMILGTNVWAIESHLYFFVQ